MSNPVIETGSENAVNLEELPPFLRTLLVMDGTVTKSLEAWFWEPVNIIAKHNDIEILTKTDIGLEVNSGDQVLQRDVNLCGDKTERIFATAQSIVSLKHLPEDIGHALIKGEIGIGELLRDKKLETYRDIFDINYYPFATEYKIEGKDNNHFGLSGDVISRSYRIWINAKPAIIVREYFPISLYQNNTD